MGGGGGVVKVPSSQTIYIALKQMMSSEEKTLEGRLQKKKKTLEVIDHQTKSSKN